MSETLVLAAARTVRAALEAHDHAIRVHNTIVRSLQAMPEKSLFRVGYASLARICGMKDDTFAALTCEHRAVFNDIVTILVDIRRTRRSLVCLRKDPRRERLRQIIIG